MSHLRNAQSPPNESAAPWPMPQLENPRWTPYTSKNHVDGSFEAILYADVNYPYYCNYSWDLDNPDKITLYLYGIQYDN